MAIRPIKHCSIIKTGEASKHINITEINGLTLVRTIGLFTGAINNTIQRYNATRGCDRGYLQGKIFHNIIQCEMQPSVGFSSSHLGGDFPLVVGRGVVMLSPSCFPCGAPLPPECFSRCTTCSRITFTDLLPPSFQMMTPVTRGSRLAARQCLL